MSEYRIWFPVDDDGNPRKGWGPVWTKPRPCEQTSRYVEATLVMPDEPQWRVAIYSDGGYLVVPHGPNDYGPKPYVLVGAPDGPTALQRAIEKAGKS